MQNIKQKIASANILKDVSPPTAISGHFDLYRKNIVLKLTAILYETIFIYFQTNEFYRPVSSVAMTLL